MSELLKLEGIVAGYGEAKILTGIDLALGQGQALALLGRNGTGKTTLINTIVGHTKRFSGRLWLNGKDVTGCKPHQRALAGIGWVPQERNIFKSLTVEENLTAIAVPGPWDLARIYRMFPRLEERRANMGSQLSGGEQQMLAIGRALMLNPKVLLLDEPLEGLAPIVVQDLMRVLSDIIRDEGLSVILVEQNARKALSITHDAVVLERGSVIHSSTAAELLAQDDKIDTLLAVSQH
ncbi:ABC transporter ATP-binding protein [Paraburkholderia sp. MMS20-SJTN17]|uniref:ABC transporter ATP-binding protein n=1 Tax=Paraburkholderia translucens TaxID=2886945 RepID=A0ABS8KCD4_9BURK|nr:ABC transporter ATP-binding protein [Paraburkholderia sp. MMS20-SJTN17]MCC8402388.1 ABC transporter ATP-binding protein [Paraburkholderia sp. MMS20-SJTN17]